MTPHDRRVRAFFSVAVAIGLMVIGERPFHAAVMALFLVGLVTFADDVVVLTGLAIVWLGEWVQRNRLS